MQLKRHPENPILIPRPGIPWEKSAVLNTAALHHNGRFHLLYRAVAHNPGDQNRSSIGYASSADGVHFERLDKPVLWSNTCPEDSKGVEDPRIVLMGDTFYMTFTNWNEKHSQLGLATSKELLRWKRHGIILPYAEYPFGHNKNSCLLPEKIGGRYALMHRPMGFGEFFQLPLDVPLHIWISYSEDMKTWTDHKIVMEARPNHWDCVKIGIAGPPIKTPKGWVLIYHGVDKEMKYRLGVALLDLEDPSKVIRRQDEPILEPEKEFEQHGDVANVVFSCGAVLLGNDLWVYYGGADTVICLARGSLSDFLDRRASVVKDAVGAGV